MEIQNKHIITSKANKKDHVMDSIHSQSREIFNRDRTLSPPRCQRRLTATLCFTFLLLHSSEVVLPLSIHLRIQDELHALNFKCLQLHTDDGECFAPIPASLGCRKLQPMGRIWQTPVYNKRVVFQSFMADIYVILRSTFRIGEPQGPGIV